MATSRVEVAAAARRPLVEVAALGAGVVFLLVGALGFVPGFTQYFDTMTFSGPESGGMLLGVFQVSVLHNVVHLLFAVAGLAAARAVAAARGYLIGAGAIYGLLGVYGLVVDKDSEANFVPVNRADDWLHLALAALLVLLGLAFGASARAKRSAAAGRVPTGA